MASDYKVAAWMESKQVSCRELRDLTGLSVDTIVNFRRGRGTPHPRTVRMVARALRLSVEMLRKGPAKRRRVKRS